MSMSVLQPIIEAESGCCSRASLGAWQVSQLRKVLKEAKQKSRFYQNLLFGAVPENITNEADLRTLPFTTSDMLRQHGMDFLTCPQKSIERIVTLKTSGTAGTAKRIFFSKSDIERTIDFFAVGMQEMVSKEDKVMILMPCRQENSVGDLLRRGLERIGTGIICGEAVKDVAETWGQMQKKRVSAVVGIPTQVLALAAYNERQDASKRILLRTVLLSADMAPQVLKHRIADSFRCEVFEHFGMTELCFGGAMECGAHTGGHIREADFLFEVIDPETGKPLPDGTEGELVVTTLQQRAMPLIRYRTGDLGVLLSDKCTCGSYIKRFLPTRGRISDHWGSLSLSLLDDIIFQQKDVIDYTAQQRENELDIVLRGLCPLNEEKAYESLRKNENLRNMTIRLSSEAISGFSNTGMQKRHFTVGKGNEDIFTHIGIDT